MKTINGKFLRRSFLNLIILGLLKEKARSGFELIKIIHKKFDILLSSGTIYPVLYSLKKDELVKAEKKGKNIMYSLIDKQKTSELLKFYLQALKSLI